MSTDEKMDILLTKINSIEQKVDSMDRRMDSMETKLGVVSNDVKDIKLTIENELRVIIWRVAEG